MTWVWGSHGDDEYSRSGRNRVVYPVVLIFMGHEWRLRLTNARVPSRLGLWFMVVHTPRQEGLSVSCIAVVSESIIKLFYISCMR